MNVLETQRLILRRLTLDDAPFMLGLLNEPSFLANIGDKGIRTLEDARQFLRTGPMDSYERNGFGHYMVELKEGRIPIGTCGLINREFIGEVDVGYAYLPAFWSKGYAFEAAAAVLEYGRTQLGLSRIVAVVSPHNAGSIRVLEKLGMKYSGPTQLAKDGEVIHLFA